MSRPEEIIKFFTQLKNRRMNFDNTAQEIIDHIDPHHSDVTTERLPGERKNQYQFDGTALYASQVFADFYQGSVFNQGTKWFSINHKDPTINDQPDNQAWLNTVRDILLQQMRFFYGPGGSAINSWALFGNGPILIEEVPARKDYQARIKYTSIPWGQYVMCEGEDGKVDQFIRELKLPAHQIFKMFNGKCSDDIKNAAEKEPLKEFTVLHSILPRDFQEYSKSSIKSNKEYDWASCWIEKDKKVELKESGYRKFPVALARYKQISGEVYARGLGEVALADAKTSNKMRELELLWGGRQLDPPQLIRRGSIINGILDIRAKGRTFVTDINNSVKPLVERADLPTFEHLHKMVQEQMLRVFHVSEILNLLSHETPQLTAFEVNARLTLLQQILGPVFGQNDVDFFSVVIDVTLDNVAHMGLLPQAPDDIAMSGEKDALNFIYEGPMARAQRNQELVNIQQSIADMSGIQPFYPEVVKMVDWEKLVRRAWEIRGTNDLLITNEEFTKAINEMTQQQNADKMAQLVGGGAEALGKVAPFLKVAREGATPGGAAAA
jgi:hypothetical protein